MATDQKKALDERTKKLSTGRIENGKEHSAYQESQQQLLAIQAEQQQNLAVARAESKADFNNTQTLAQAAEIGAISAAEAEQAAQAGGGVMLNPATQTVLSKYGVGQPKFSRTQSHTQQVTKQNIVINNNVTSNTTNDVKVPPNVGGPLQGRPLQFKEGSGQGGSTGKFKAWISSTLNRQKEEGARRDREYRNRETSLTKSANRMMKKLEDIGKTIGSRMDPRKIGSTWMSQLKTLFLLFGFGYITSNWTKILSRVSKIEKWFRGDFLGTIKEYFSKVTGFFGIGKAAGSGESGFHKMIREFFGGKPGEGLFESFKKLLFSGDESLLGYVKLWLKHAVEERAEAIKLLKFPKLDVEDVVGTIGKVGQYLGDLFSVILKGSKGAERTIHEQFFEKASKGMVDSLESRTEAATETEKRFLWKDPSGHVYALKGNPSSAQVRSLLDKGYEGIGIEKVDKGIKSLFVGEDGKRGRYGLSQRDIVKSGELTGSTSSTFAQGLQISSNFSSAIKGYEKFDSAGLAVDLTRLHNAAARKNWEKEGQGIPVNGEFIDMFPDDVVKKLENEGKIKRKVPYHIIAKPIDKEDPFGKAETAYINKYLLSTAGIAGITEGPFPYAKEAIGATTGAAIGAVGGLPGVVIGGTLGYLIGEFANSPFGTALLEGIGSTIKNWTSNDYELDAAPGEAPEGGETVYFPEITVDGIQELVNYLANGDVNKFVGIDPTNIEFIKALENTYYNLTSSKKDLRGQSTASQFLSDKLIGQAITGTELGISQNSIEAKNRLIQLHNLGVQERKNDREETEYLKNSRAAQAFGGGGVSTTTGTAATRGRSTASTNQSHRDYVNRMRPLLKEKLLAKSYDPQTESPSGNRFVPRNEVEEYADILTAQSSLESDWGNQHKAKDPTINNYSGITTNNHSPSESYHINGSRYWWKRFNSVDDWAEYFINILNKKWNAFSKGPSEYFNQLQHNPAPNNDPRLYGQMYAEEGDEYITANLGRLSQVKSILGHSASERPTLTSSQTPATTPQVTSTPTGPVPSDLAIAASMQTQAGTYDYKGTTRTLGTNDYDGKCTYGVATFYRRVGGPELNGNWWNSDYTTATATNIGRVGFEEVWHGTRESANANEFGTPLPGDIMVQFGTKSSGENSSHAQMWDGQHWVSDTIQARDASHTGNTFVYSRGRMGDRSAILYRYTGNQTPTTPITDEQRNSYYQQSGVSTQAQPEAEPEEQQSRSFLEIFKDQITNFFSNFGSASDFVGGTIKDAVSKVFSDGDYYRGPITKDFTDYETYKEHEKLGKLPEGLPEGLSFTDWKGRVFDMTGSMPQNLDVDVVKEPELNKPEQKILSQYIKNGPKGDLGMTKLEEATYRSLIPMYTEDENYRNQLSEEQVAKIERIIESDAEKRIQDVLSGVNPNLGEAETLATTTISPESIELSEDQPSIMSFFDPKKFERKEDKITTIRDGVDEIKELLAENLNINSSNGYILSKNVEATTQGTMANVTAFKNLAGSLSTQQANSVAYTPSLMGSSDSTSGIS